MLNINQSVADCDFLTKLVEGVRPKNPPVAFEDAFEVICKEDFDQMSAQELQLLFRHKHIVVRGVPHSRIAFDRKGLQTLGSWDQPRTFQGMQSESIKCLLTFTGIRFVH